MGPGIKGCIGNYYDFIVCSSACVVLGTLQSTVDAKRKDFKFKNSLVVKLRAFFRIFKVIRRASVQYNARLSEFC